jgi:NAD(P)-dependent dehydrogenase (short-subunit alcohol dehydrogenase family)
MNSNQSLDGRVALVTGASRGIGAVTAKAFAAAGAATVVAARSAVALDALVDEISAHGGAAHPVPTDVSDAGAVEHLVDETVATFGHLDIAFNNAAGGGQAPTPIVDLPVDAYDSAIANSLRSVFLCLKYETIAMLDNGGGAIVNMASTAGLEAVGGLAGYVSAKHGVLGLTKTAALENGDRNIRVNAVAPGPILTENLERAGPEMQRRAGAAVAMHRVGSPEEVANVVLWLCSDQASYLTGITVPIDGGKLAGMQPFAEMGGAS